MTFTLCDYAGMSASHPLRDWRNKVGDYADREGEPMRQDALAADLGIATSHLSQIETGDRRPSLAVASRISAVTGISIDRIAAFEKPKSGEAA